MTTTSEHYKDHPFWGAPLQIADVPCYRGCSAIVKVPHMIGDRISRWHSCGTCKTKADNGGFNDSGAT